MMTEDSVEINLPEKIPGGQGLSGAIEHQVSIPEAKQRMMTMDKLITTGRSNDEIQLAMEKTFNMSEASTNVLMMKCLKKLSQESSERRPYMRDMARRRIYSYLGEAKIDRRWGDLANLEKILSDIEGTKVSDEEATASASQRLQESILRVLNESDPKEVMAIIERERTISANGDVSERETCVVQRK